MTEKTFPLVKNEVNEIRAERLACTANPLALVTQQQPAYHPQNHPNHYTQNFSTKSQQTTRNKGKAIVNSSASIYDQEPATITEDMKRSKENNSPRINRGTGYENQRVVNVAGARENVAKKLEFRLKCRATVGKDDTDDESDDQELEAHYMYMAHVQVVTPDIADFSGPRFGNLLGVYRSDLIYCSSGLSGKYIVLAVCQIVHCSSGLSFLTAVCLIRQRFLKTFSHSDLGNKPLPISFLGSGLVFLLHSENGVNILKSIDEGPFQMGTFRETLAEGNEGALHLGPERPRVYSNLSLEYKERYNTDIRAPNILLQRLPKDIYTLFNRYTDAKYIWDNVKMPLEGSELTKEDRESQLFVTAVKLNRGLRDSNYDQLYAYLKQHEAHANENKMMLDRFTQHTVDPLALMSNVSHQQYYSQSSTTLPHFAHNTQLDSGISPTDNLIENLTNTLALLTQSNKTYLPQTNNQLITSSYTRNQATVQDSKVVVQNVQGRQNRGQGNNARGAGATGYGGAQNRVGNVNPGQARQIKCYNGNDNAVDKDVDEKPVQDLALNVDNVFQTDDCDAFDFDVDEAPTT
ncbi:hypothetical protein Tco_1313081 [Tanacetum coccineum]